MVSGAAETIFETPGIQAAETILTIDAALTMTALIAVVAVEALMAELALHDREAVNALIGAPDETTEVASLVVVAGGEEITIFVGVAVARVVRIFRVDVDHAETRQDIKFLPH